MPTTQVGDLGQSRHEAVTDAAAQDAWHGCNAWYADSTCAGDEQEGVLQWMVVMPQHVGGTNTWPVYLWMRACIPLYVPRLCWVVVLEESWLRYCLLLWVWVLLPVAYMRIFKWEYPHYL